jgi:hypothetical protein
MRIEVRGSEEKGANSDVDDEGMGYDLLEGEKP